MKKLILLVAMAVVALAGCQKSELVDPIESNDVFTASVEEFSAQTKTALTSGNHVVWSAGDHLAIFQGSTLANEYEINESSAGKANATFMRVMSSGNDFYAGTELPCNVAFYPYAEGLCLEGDMSADGKKAYTVSTVLLPAVQMYEENSFANGAFPMVAVTPATEDHNLSFKNVLGAMKLQLKGTQVVKSIKVEGANGEKLSGAATVTAYANNLTPAINMTGSDDACQSVTLDCGDGVQLNETEAINFYIALPPVLFQNGFIVTVTDVEEKEYTVTATDANTVLRSSILVMPVVNLDTPASDEPEEDKDVTYIEYVFLSKSSLIMMPNTSYSLVADIDPVDVTYPTLTWVSSDETVASVDANGKVTAKGDGSATITALAVGGERASCTVTVKTPVTFAANEYKDYIDEHGVNYGKGVAVAGVIWAPVNCGYEPTTADYKGYPYGKLYQWGRKYGQGYDSNDASYPSGDNMIQGPVVPSWGSSETYKDAFFYGSYDWCTTQIDDLWVDADGKKTKKDPCPDGWRVPTVWELIELCGDYNWTTHENQKGSYFVGEYTYIEGLPQVFFPAAGSRSYYDGNANGRGSNGGYWSSRPNSSYAYGLGFSNGFAGMSSGLRAYGYSVRCVQE